MELFLLRHGLAVERGTPGFAHDADRPLTPPGRRQLRKITTALQRMDLSFDVILSSPFLRTRQTAEIVAGELKIKPRLVCVAELQPGAPAEKLIQLTAAVKARQKTVLLVGHEPDLGELISLLVTGATGAGFALKKGGLAKLEIENLHTGKCATLAWLLNPRLMKLMS
jgi:phosphohistidine phosphatase